MYYTVEYDHGGQKMICLLYAKLNIKFLVEDRTNVPQNLKNTT